MGQSLSLRWCLTKKWWSALTDRLLRVNAPPHSGSLMLFWLAGGFIVLSGRCRRATCQDGLGPLAIEVQRAQAEIGTRGEV